MHLTHAVWRSSVAEQIPLSDASALPWSVREPGAAVQEVELMSRFRSPRVLAVVLAIAAIGFAPPSLSGQALYGSIVGTVTDAQGGITPGVVLVATNTGTGLKVEAQT